ncbi:hypothetical protein ABPG72_013885, partial [Tetrahymena utriculariae]
SIQQAIQEQQVNKRGKNNYFSEEQKWGVIILNKQMSLNFGIHILKKVIQRVKSLNADPKIYRKMIKWKWRNKCINSLDKEAFKIHKIKIALDDQYGIQLSRSSIYYQKNRVQIWKSENSELAETLKQAKLKQFNGIMAQEQKILITKQEQLDHSLMIRKGISERDGARSHISKAVLELNRQKNINILQNDPWSLNINVIEFVWAHMESEFQKIKFKIEVKNRDDLIKVITEIWKKLPQEFINNFIGYVKEKLQLIIKQINGEYLS